MLSRIRKYVDNKKYFLISVVVLSIIALAFTATELALNAVGRVETAKLEEAIGVYDAANDKMYAENMAAFEKVIYGSFSEPQIIRIGQKTTNYGISINGNPLPENESVIYSDRPTVAVLLSENYGKDSLAYLPRSVIEKTSVIALSKPEDLIKVTFGDGMTMKNNVYDYHYGQTLSYLVSGLTPGTIVTIEIKPEIARSLNLSDNIIEIVYNKDVEAEAK